ncbi:serine hydrolase domain-containing protein [Serratia rubidaea]|uniref:Esterase estB n=1 Tax=Serratia rubidaea TaxID=61652 RepID=A0A448SQN2_SERRU|nr:serine hydrolase domain-containing protein [Serratia rubidaea]MDC6119007.1 serine hydrolase [Serratia rubidaea]MEB7585106.1 beta-lactamase family protein [Serratia rubidaea]VEI69992.1 Esterase estB [Serratia rubidaea]
MAGNNQTVIQRLQQVNQRAVAQGRIVGSVVLVAQHGKTIAALACGEADRERRRPMRRNALFRLASVSKPFITLAALRMVEQGKLTLDDAVSRWLPWFSPALGNGETPVILIRHLLTHTAGLDYRFKQPADGPYHQRAVMDGLELSTLTLEQNLRRLADVPLAAEPGSRFSYSLSIDLLGAVLEQAAEMPLPQLFNHWVAQPLGLEDSGFVARDAGRLTGVYYNTDAGPAVMQDGLRVALPPEFGFDVEFAPSRALDAAAYPSAGAGMVGSADDVLRLVETLRAGGNGLLQPATVALLQRPHVSAAEEVQGPGWGFGFGGALLTDAALASTPQHNGTLQWGGVYGHSWFCDPQAGLSVVALTNTAFEGMCGAYPQEVRDAVYAGLAR